MPNRLVSPNEDAAKLSKHDRRMLAATVNSKRPEAKPQLVALIAHLLHRYSMASIAAAVIANERESVLMRAVVHAMNDMRSASIERIASSPSVEGTLDVAAACVVSATKERVVLELDPCGRARVARLRDDGLEMLEYVSGLLSFDHEEHLTLGLEASSLLEFPVDHQHRAALEFIAAGARIELRAMGVAARVTSRTTKKQLLARLARPASAAAGSTIAA